MPRKKWPSRVAERRAAGDGAEAAAAEGGAQLAVDELVEQRVLGRAAPRPAPPVSCAARPVDGHLGGLVEDLALAVGLGLGLGAS